MVVVDGALAFIIYYFGLYMPEDLFRGAVLPPQSPQADPCLLTEGAL